VVKPRARLPRKEVVLTFKEGDQRIHCASWVGKIVERTTNIPGIPHPWEQIEEGLSVTCLAQSVDLRIHVRRCLPWIYRSTR
jgi:hypothetical protein